MTLNTFPTFLTFLTFGLVRAGWLRLVTTKTGGRAIHWWQVSALLFPGHLRQKGRKGQKGGACHEDEHLSDLSDLSDTEAAVPGHLGEIPGRASGAPRKPWVADRDPRQ
jgi:hypothetical protein